MSDSRLNIGSGMTLIAIIIFFIALMEISNFPDFTNQPVAPVDIQNLSSVIIYAFAGLGFLIGGSILVSSSQK